MWEYLAHGLKSVFEVLEVALLALFDERIYDVDLSAAVYLLPYALVEACGLCIILMDGLDRFAAGRKFVDNAHVEVAVEGHGERTGYGGGCHHQDVGRHLALGPESGALCHSEAVLLVDHSQSQTGKDHRVFDDGVGSHEYVYLALGQTVEYVGASSSFDHSGEQFYVYIHISQHLADGGQVLLCQYLCGRHDARLVAVAYGYEHGHERHQRLARAHVSLQQPVHLSATRHVVSYLPHHAFLRIGEVEGQVVAVEVVELGAGAAEDVAAILAAVVAGVAQYVELHIKELFKLEAVAGLLHFAGVVRVMDLA